MLTQRELGHIGQPEQKYYNEELYEILTSKKWDDGGFHYLEETIRNKKDDSTIKRKVKSVVRIYSPNSARRIRERQSWKKFGKALKGSCTLQGDDVWMEFNPELLKSKNTQKCIAKRIINHNSTEKYKVIDGGSEALNNTIDELYRSTCRLKGVNPVDKYSIIDMSIQEKSQILTWTCNICKGGHMSKDCPNRGTFGAKLDGEAIQSKSLDNTRLKQTYVPPHLKNRRKTEDRDETNRNERGERKEVPLDEKTSIRLSNLSPDTTDEDLKQWLRQFDLPRFRLNILKDKFTGGFRDIAFLKFNHHNMAQRALEKLSGKIMEHSIINVEWSKY